MFLSCILPLEFVRVGSRIEPNPYVYGAKFALKLALFFNYEHFKITFGVVKLALRCAVVAVSTLQAFHILVYYSLLTDIVNQYVGP